VKTPYNRSAPPFSNSLGGYARFDARGGVRVGGTRYKLGALSCGMPNVTDTPFKRLEKANTRLKKDKNALADQLKKAKSNSSDTIL
jgi:hypothetical protein